MGDWFNDASSSSQSSTGSGDWFNAAQSASGGGGGDWFNGATHAAGKVAHVIGDALDFQRAKSQDAIFHGGSSDENRKRLREHLGIEKDYEDPKFMGMQVPEWATRLGRGFTDTVLDTATDPLTYETMGGSVLRKGAVGALGLLGRGVDAATKAPIIGGKIEAARDAGKAFRNIAQDTLVPDGKAVRTQGQEAVDFARGAEAKTSAHSGELDRRLQKQYDEIRSHLTEAEFGEALQVRNGERQAYTNEGRLLISPKAVGAADALKTLTKNAYALRADESGQRRIANYLAEPRPETSKTVLATRTEKPDMSTLDGLVSSLRQDTKRYVKAGEGPAKATSGISDEDARDLWDDYRRTPAVRTAYEAMSPTQKAAAEESYVRSTIASSGAGTRLDPERLLSDGGTAIRKTTPAKRRVVARAASTPYELPPELSEFAGQPGTLGSKNYRRDYVPGPRDAAEVSPDREASTFNRLDPYDANAKQREQITIDPAQHAMYDDAFRGSLANTAKQVGASELRNELKERFGGALPQEIHNLFDVHARATGAERTNNEKWLDGWRKFVALPKGAVVGLLPRHMFNIANLLSLHSLSAIPEAVVNAAKIVKDPERRYEILKKGIELGAIGGEASERSTPVTELLGRADSSAVLNRLGPVGKLAQGAAKLGGGYMKNMNKATWAFDDAAAQALAKRHAASGISGYTAGRTARKDLVDYENVSHATQLAKNFMPFATFNTSIPGAVAGAIARNPARVEAMNRATGGAYLGDHPEIGGHQIHLSAPTAEVGSGDVPAFARKSATDPLKGLADLGGATIAGRGDHCWTSGQNLKDPKQLVQWLLSLGLSGVPEAREALSALGLSHFKPRSLGETLLQSSTGLDVK